MRKLKKNRSLLQQNKELFKSICIVYYYVYSGFKSIRPNIYIRRFI